MKVKKSKKAMLIISVIIMLVLIIGITYAAFHFIGTGSKNNVITLGKLQLTLEEGNEITVMDAMPVSDEDGLKSEGFSFTLRNTGNVPIAYSIYLDDIALEETELKLDTKFLKYNLEFNGVSDATQYLDDRLVDGDRELTSGTLEGGSSNQYLLRVWITGDINGDIQNQVWKGRIRLEGTQSR